MKKKKFIETINDCQGIIQTLCKVYYHTSEDQKDASQDIILQLWKSFDSFRGESQITTWIYRISLNTILGKVRREKKVIKAESISEGHLSDDHFSIDNLKADDDVEQLKIIIQSLKEVDKAITLLYLEGYKNQEIAEILQMTPSNVATRFNRLKSELRTKLTQQTHATK